MKKQFFIIGAQVHTYADLTQLLIQGYIDAYPTTKLRVGHRLVIASLSHRGMVINATVCQDPVQVLHAGRFRRYRIYFNQAAIAVGSPESVRFNQNFFYLKVERLATAA